MQCRHYSRFHLTGVAPSPKPCGLRVWVSPRDMGGEGHRSDVIVGKQL